MLKKKKTHDQGKFPIIRQGSPLSLVDKDSQSGKEYQFFNFWNKDRRWQWLGEKLSHVFHPEKPVVVELFAR